MSTKQQNTLQKGFTLIEMIGVLAVIAILGAVVAPKVFDAINDAKVDSLAEEINTIKTAVTNYYKDTGRFPYQYSNNARNQDLIKQRRGVKNWKGPYIDKGLNNPINPSGYFNVGQGGWKFDIDGDGTPDYGKGTTRATVAMAWFNGLSASQAKALSNIMDSDGDKTTGKTAWYKTGRVRTSNSGNPGTGTNITLYVLLGSL